MARLPHWLPHAIAAVTIIRLLLVEPENRQGFTPSSPPVCWANRWIGGRQFVCERQATTSVGLCAECYQQVVDGC